MSSSPPQSAGNYTSLFEVEPTIDYDGHDGQGHHLGDDVDAVPQPPADPAAASRKGARNLVVSQLPRTIDTAILRDIFSEFGELVTALVMMDVQSGRSRGFGFVWFKEAADAQRAIEAMNGKALDDSSKPLKVFVSEHPDGLSEAPGIDVLNFPSSIAHSAGRDLFSQFGKLVRYEIVNPEGRGSGSGSTGYHTATVAVEYESVLEARAAVNALHGVRELRFDNVAVNLHLPLVTKYLIPGAKRTTNSNNASRTSTLGPRRTTPGASGSSRFMNASASHGSSWYSSHGHVFGGVHQPSPHLQPQMAQQPQPIQFMQAPQQHQQQFAVLGPNGAPIFYTAAQAPGQQQQHQQQQPIYVFPQNVGASNGVPPHPHQQQQQPPPFFAPPAPSGQPGLAPPQGYYLVPAPAPMANHQQQQQQYGMFAQMAPQMSSQSSISGNQTNHFLSVGYNGQVPQPQPQSYGNLYPPQPVGTVSQAQHPFASAVAGNARSFSSQASPFATTGTASTSHSLGGVSAVSGNDAANIWSSRQH
jgi:hypothetical protein